MKTKFSIVVLASLWLSACGGTTNSVPDPTIDLSADSYDLTVSGDTTLRVTISSSQEQEIVISTTLGTVGMLSDKQVTWITSLKKADIPFACNNEVGSATVTAVWTTESIQDEVSINCK
ncbi:MAG: hypothetical protein JRJ87_09480 [Deltaproteobacteria bacterium]|nr:hypothetical protein [Deltaproteobacteria bacterium]